MVFHSSRLGFEDDHPDGGREPRLYRRFVPFFAGLILGQHMVGGLWTIVGIAQGEVVYRFFR